MRKKTPRTLLRISEVAKLAGVSIPTIKYYLKEGLLPDPVKTSRTMAYYESSTVERVIKIKKLQKEKFLPLDIIKRVIDNLGNNEEEILLTEAIFKSHKFDPSIPDVHENAIENRMAYPLGKIRILEEEGIITPKKEPDGKYYDALDMKIIELVKSREENKLPFDYTVEMFKIYLKAIREAVINDIKLFSKSMLGNTSIEHVVNLMMNVDTTVDDFMVLIRQRLARDVSTSALRKMDEISHNMTMLLVLPGRSKFLPEKPPDELVPRIVYFFLCGKYDGVIQLAEENRHAIPQYYPTALILADILRGDVPQAVKTVEELIPRPSVNALENMCAALAYIFSLAESSGISRPLYLSRKVLEYLKRIESATSHSPLVELFTKYICGAFYTMMPWLFDTQLAGIRILSRVEATLHNNSMELSHQAEWLRNVLVYEIFPEMELKTNRLLANAYMESGDYNSAKEKLERLTRLADPDSEQSLWARNNILKINKYLKSNFHLQNSPNL